jgi:hypothetical protein
MRTLRAADELQTVYKTINQDMSKIVTSTKLRHSLLGTNSTDNSKAIEKIY